MSFFKINLRLGGGQPVGHQLAIAGLDNVELLTSHKPVGLHSLLWG
jgi:hypothetical protein